jgi:hypothetical protein
MKTRKIEVTVYEPEDGKILAVYHDGLSFPIYYDRVYQLFLDDRDIVEEVERRCIEN